MPQTILIIEDESEIADSVQFAISNAGMAAHWANSGQQGLELLAVEPDLIILDVGLPDISGFELLKDIRKTNDIPIIFLTARNEEIDRIIGLEIGADDYVTKPFSPRELVARVKVILKRVQQPKNSTNNHPILSIDTSRQKAILKGHNLPLTRAEFLLLEVFFKQIGRVFSRRQLIDYIWSSNHPSDDRAIDTHIKTLRAKIKSVDDSSEYIITHRGLGYSLEISQS